MTPARAHDRFIYPLALNLFFLALGLLWIRMIPYDEAPDESSHYHFSVEFVVQHHRLPVAGIDDVETAQSRQDTSGGWGGDTYVVYPQLNYLLSAATGLILQHAAGWPLYRGARIASLVWGLIFLNFLFLSCEHILKNNRHAALLTFAVAFIPQILFLSSYINADIHSLALSSAFMYCALRTFDDPSPRMIWTWAAVIGLFCSAKYNYVSYAVLFAALLIEGYRHNRWSARICGRILGTSAVMALLLSGFWYVRNYRLYGDAFGLYAKHAILVQSGALATMQPMTWHTFRSFVMTYAVLVFESFFALFGCMTLRLSSIVYGVLGLGVTLTGISLVREITGGKDAGARRALMGFVGFFLLNVTLLLWYTFRWDGQPQGRYLFPILAPFALLVAYLVRRNPARVRYVYALGGLTACLLMLSNILLIQRYGFPG